ncbi:MAG: parvulin peptidyl-prolyl isomerase [Ignavibacteria bacterium]|nr:parvulin peptidyl-prolyl isomerase [Ignavibacteria bacterium]
MFKRSIFPVENKFINFFFLLLICGSNVLLTNAQHKSLERIIAVVDNEIILESELNAQVDFYMFNNRIDTVSLEIKKQILEGMITDKLILAQAIEESVNVSDDEVQQQLDAIVQQRASQAGGEKKLEELYGMSLARIKIEFRDEMRKQLLAQRLQQTKFGNEYISARDVEMFFSEYKDSLPIIPATVELAHIFNIPKPNSEVQRAAEQKAQRILDSLRLNGDFSSFAKQYSDDPGSASEGGDLGFVRRGQFVKEFEEAVFALSDSEFAPVVKTQFGFHVIQLLERRGESVHPRHILIRVGKSASDDTVAINFLQSLKDSVAAGKSFSELAKKYSEDDETSFKGGVMEEQPFAQLDDELKSVLDTLSVGSISPPLRAIAGTNSGFQIVYLKNKTLEHQANLRDDWKRIEKLALNYKRSNEYRKWIEELKKNIYWESRL